MTMVNSGLKGLKSWELPSYKVSKRAQNRAARLVTRTKTQDHITPVLRDLHWLPVQ